jgi:tetratricopeptide (TPR) repeat protein
LLATALGQEGESEAAHETLDEARSLGSHALDAMTGIVRARRALSRDERLAEELLILARLYIDEGNAVLALGCLEEADTITHEWALDREELRRHINQITPGAARRIGSGLPGAITSPNDTQVQRHEAIENFLEVLRFMPDNAEVQLQVASLYAQSGDRASEIGHYLEALKIWEKKEQWQELLDRLPSLVSRFPDAPEFGESLKRVRTKVRLLQLIEGDDTQTAGGMSALSQMDDGSPDGGNGAASRPAEASSSSSSSPGAGG